MAFLRKLFGGEPKQPEPQQPGPNDIVVTTKDDQVALWSDSSEWLPIEESARKGVEALAGVLITGDAFGVSRAEDRTFAICGEFYYGKSPNEDFDFIGAYLRPVELIEGTYPKLGPESQKMILQPLAGGDCFARWNTIDRSRAEESLHGMGMMANDANLRETRQTPITLGEIPPQGEEDETLPTFLIMHTPDLGWQIWRRFAPVVPDGATVRDERYVQIYPTYEPETAWRFRTHLEEGRVEFFQGE